MLCCARVFERGSLQKKYDYMPVKAVSHPFTKPVIPPLVSSPPIKNKKPPRPMSAPAQRIIPTPALDISCPTEVSGSGSPRKAGGLTFTLALALESDRIGTISSMDAEMFLLLIRWLPLKSTRWSEQEARRWRSMPRQNRPQPTDLSGLRACQILPMLRLKPWCLRLLVLQIWSGFCFLPTMRVS